MKKVSNYIGLKVFWVDLQNQNLSKINISCQKMFESDIHNQRKYDRKHEDFIAPFIAPS